MRDEYKLHLTEQVQMYMKKDSEYKKNLEREDNSPLEDSRHE